MFCTYDAVVGVHSAFLPFFFFSNCSFILLLRYSDHLTVSVFHIG